MVNDIRRGFYLYWEKNSEIFNFYIFDYLFRGNVGILIKNDELCIC